VISRKLQFVITLLVLGILAMGLYLVHLKRKAESIVSGPAAQVLEPPPNGPSQQLTLYIASDADSSIRPVSLSSALPSDPGERGRLALQTLIAHYQQPDSMHPLGTAAAVQDVFFPDTASAVVNLNADFAAIHPSGIAVEQLTVDSMVLTLKAQDPQLTRVRFLVAGKAPDTLAGHFDLSGWLDVATITNLHSSPPPTAADNGFEAPAQSPN
jgi:hypothetical protein